jgi:hypothetical protein
LGAGEEAEHRFDVDGEPFPWYITEEGPRFTRVEDGSFVVHVPILPNVGVGEVVAVHVDDKGLAPYLTLGGELFPWSITEKGVDIHVASSLTVVRLGFFARSVDVDCECHG